MSEETRGAGQDQWLRFFNRVLYARLPALYNAMDVGTLGAWWRLVSRALRYVPQGGRVMEIGFGPGRLHAELARRSDACFGLDLAWGMCRYTKRRLQREKLTARIVRGDAFQLPYARASFDTLVSTFAFSGLPAAQAAMDEMARVAAPGGRVVLVDIGIPPDANWLGRNLARLWERMGDFLYDQPSMMRKAGLKIVRFELYGPGKHIRAVVGEKAAGE